MPAPQAVSALVTADLHLSPNPRDSYRFAAMERLADLIVKTKVETLVLLGDLTEEKNFHPATLVNDVVELIHILSRLVESVVFMMGNHDYTDADCPFFYFLRRLKNVTWIQKPRRVDIAGTCLFLPHTLNYKRDWEGQEMEGFDWIFAHNTFEGASTEHGKRLSGIPLSVFPRNARVVAGDIHTPQEVGCVTYVGSPYQIDFGDSFDPRVLVLTQHNMLSMPLPGPQKRLVVLEPGYKAKDFEEVAAGDVVKIQYLLPADEREKWSELRDTLRARFQALGCLVYAVQPVLEKAERSGSVVSKRRVNSDVEMVRMFGAQHKVSAEVLDIGLALVEGT